MPEEKAYGGGLSGMGPGRGNLARPASARYVLPYAVPQPPQAPVQGIAAVQKRQHRGGSPAELGADSRDARILPALLQSRIQRRHGLVAPLGRNVDLRQVDVQLRFIAPDS